VLALHRKAASGRSHGAVDAIELDGELQGVQVVAAWYEPQAGSQRSEYTLGTARADTTRYSLEHVLGLPRLDYSAETDTYRLVDTQSQLDALDAALRLTMPERAGSARTHGEAREAEGRRRSDSTRCLLHPPRSHRHFVTVGRLPRTVLPRVTSS
jgi:hypothetical protein